MRVWSIMRATVGTCIIGGVFLAGYYFSVWGYFGLASGQGRYDERGVYWLMLVGGSAAIALGISICALLIWKGRRRKRSDGGSLRGARGGEGVMSRIEKETMSIFADRVRVHFAFLDQLGYQGPDTSSVGRAGVVYALIADYNNDQVGRRVSVSLHSSDTGDRAGVAIWRLPSNSYRRDLMNFPLLVWSRAPDLELKRLQLQSYDGSLEERLNSFLSFHAELLQSEAFEILAGEAWEEGLYDY